MTGKPIIEIQDLTIAYDDNTVMQNVNCTINQGDIFVVMGRSGCGKSTLLKAITGLKRPKAGKIYIEGVDFWAQSKAVKDGIMHKTGILYQSGALFSSMTLAENVSLPLEQYTDLSPAEIAELVSLKLSLVGLSGFEKYYPSEISGGMKKRAGLARALALDPKIVFFDEPSAGLDPVSARLLDDLIKEIKESLGATVVIVTHELASIFAIGTNAVYLDVDTKTAAGHGSPKELLKNPPNDRVYEFLTRGENKKQGGHRE